MANQKNKGKRTQKRNLTSQVTTQANPSNRSIVNRPYAPIVRTTPEGMVIRNKEYRLLITSSGAAATVRVSGFGLNPADSNIFPWLSGLAIKHTYYRWRSLKVMYASGCPTTQRGTVCLGAFYDREDLDAWIAAGDALRDLTQVVGSTTGPVWGSTITCHPNGTHSSEIQVVIDVNRAHMRTKWHLIDPATASTALDNQAVAVFLGSVTTSNGSGADNDCGYLWVEYEIELMHPTARAIGGGTLDRYNGDDVPHDLPDTTAPRPKPPPSPGKPTNPSSVRDDAGVSGPGRETQA